MMKESNDESEAAKLQASQSPKESSTQVHARTHARTLCFSIFSTCLREQSGMANRGLKSVASGLLFLNLILYVIVAIIAGWAINYSIYESENSLKGVSPPVRLFPIYFPIGNLATGFFAIFALIAGVVGISTSLTGLHDVTEGHPASMMSAAASAIVAWTLTFLAMGLACKEISIGWRPASLRVLEAFTIILTGTQLLCAGSLHAGANAAIIRMSMGTRTWA